MHSRTLNLPQTNHRKRLIKRHIPTSSVAQELAPFLGQKNIKGNNQTIILRSNTCHISRTICRLQGTFDRGCNLAIFYGYKWTNINNSLDVKTNSYNSIVMHTNTVRHHEYNSFENKTPNGGYLYSLKAIGKKTSNGNMIASLWKKS